jgi:kynurenine 3-monooxygenase
MVPFYGQGMNAGFEDVRVLFSFLDKHTPTSISSHTGTEISQYRAIALAEYSAQRTEDAHAINDLALQNYIEMRASVVDPVYKVRKWLEEKISVWMPRLGWQTKYSMVSFGNRRYSEVVRQSERQGKLLVMGLMTLVQGSLLLGGFIAWDRWRRGLGRGFRVWTEVGAV